MLSCSSCCSTLALARMQEGVEAPIHVMYQPDFLAARVAALEDVEMYVEDVAFARALCEETLAVKRDTPMKARPQIYPCPACMTEWSALEEKMKDWLRCSPDHAQLSLW